MSRRPSNAEIADALQLLGDLLQLQGAIRHRVLAYHRGAARVRSTGESVAEMALRGRAVELPDIGATLQAKIVELSETGTIAALDRARGETPEGLVQVARLEGIGPKRALAAWQTLGVTGLDDLRAAVDAGRLSEVPGIGASTQESVARQLGEEREPGAARVSLGIAMPQAQAVLEVVRAVPEVGRAELAGSLRRGRGLVHDADLVVATDAPAAVRDALAGASSIAALLEGGERRQAVLTQSGLRVEIAMTPPETFGNLLQHATGSAAHNVRLREMAVRRGWSISEHGITTDDGSVLTHDDEREVYAALGLAWIPPELREDRGELEVAASGVVPELVTQEQILGDVHVHSDWSDGRADMATMVEAAVARGYRYLGFADHSVSLAMTRGLSPERVHRQWEAIDALAERVPDIVILKCTEVDILGDGRLDFDDDLLAGFDVVVASLHSGLQASGAEATARVLAAIDNPHVRAIGHPTGRMLGRRPGLELDIDRIAERAAATGTALEINGQPRRLDLDSAMARVALDAGVDLLVSSDAHTPEDLAFQEFAGRVARRAGAAPGRVLNTRFGWWES
ncbi:MAG: DNA polymerase/3'-5' exonuclease PolX [Thermoleophilia bacterium]